MFDGIGDDGNLLLFFFLYDEWNFYEQQMREMLDRDFSCVDSIPFDVVVGCKMKKK